MEGQIGKVLVHYLTSQCGCQPRKQANQHQRCIFTLTFSLLLRAHRSGLGVGVIATHTLAYIRIRLRCNGSLKVS